MASLADIANPIRRHKRLTVVVAVGLGLSLPLVTWLWREGDLPGASTTPFSRAASTYNVDGVYGPGGWLLPVALRTIAVHADHVSVCGPGGKLVVGAHAIRSDHGAVTQACAVHPGSPGAVLVSRGGRHLRIQAGRCVIDGRRA
ncbi:MULTISPECIES: hypothetical protein [Acidithiobacillus]|uniref:hypothetical protein n=1 Tax=Acidithiobacillus TaxID=119977 RepID=UPI001C07EAB8|nr:MULTISPECIES: hypothetical protein [Acidithiobacillus]MBU2854746.1 hypothetical protein [Acidithiobacillus ferriphilus]MDA8245763.1 hypothetical protein [Acidithiobacillus sp.]